jgi:hypothetical protein
MVRASWPVRGVRMDGSVLTRGRVAKALTAQAAGDASLRAKPARRGKAMFAVGRALLWSAVSRPAGSPKRACAVIQDQGPADWYSTTALSVVSGWISRAVSHLGWQIHSGAIKSNPRVLDFQARHGGLGWQSERNVR